MWLNFLLHTEREITTKTMTQFTDLVLTRLDATGVFTQQQLSIIKANVQALADSFDMKPKGNQVVPYDYLQPDGYKAYLVIKKTEGLSDKSLKAYKFAIDHFLLAVMKPLDKIVPTDIQLYLYKKQTADGNQVSSVNNIRRYLSSFFGWLYDGHWIEENPMKQVKAVKGLKKVYKPITAEQFELMMEKTESPRDRAVLAVLAGSGIRVGEACTMRLDQLDLQNRRFRVRGKGNKERICFLTPRAKCELQRYLNTRKDDSPYVFVTERSPKRKVATSTIQGIFKRLTQELGFNVHPHKLRHFFADNAHEAGIDVLDISRMLGHESVDTTKIYMSINADDLAYKHARLR